MTRRDFFAGGVVSRPGGLRAGALTLQAEEAAGHYRLEAPLAAHLQFSNSRATLEKVLLWDDPGFRAIHFEIYSTSHVGSPGCCRTACPPDLFGRLRARATQVVIDADLRSF